MSRDLHSLASAFLGTSKARNWALNSFFSLLPPIGGIIGSSASEERAAVVPDLSDGRTTCAHSSAERCVTPHRACTNYARTLSLPRDNGGSEECAPSSAVRLASFPLPLLCLGAPARVYFPGLRPSRGGSGYGVFLDIEALDGSAIQGTF